MEKEAESAHGKVIRITDQTRSRVQRLIASLEKQAETLRQSGVEPLISQRDQLLQRYKRAGGHRRDHPVLRKDDRGISPDHQRPGRATAQDHCRAGLAVVHQGEAVVPQADTLKRSGACWKAIDVRHDRASPKHLVEEAFDTPKGILVRRCFRLVNMKSMGLAITLADITEEN